MTPIEEAFDYLTAALDACTEVLGIEDSRALRPTIPGLTEVAGAVFVTMTAGRVCGLCVTVHPSLQRFVSLVTRSLTRPSDFVARSTKLRSIVTNISDIVAHSHRDLPKLHQLAVMVIHDSPR